MAVDISALSQMQIGVFFQRNAPVSQTQCNDKARDMTGKLVTPTACQGGNSYTVDAGQVIVQFRAPDSPLDMMLMKSIEQAYPGFTPQHKHHDLFYHLHVYTMNNIGGVSMYLVRDLLYKNNYALLQNTIDNYARFFASAFHHTPESMSGPDRGQLLQQYSSQLQRLRKGLPQRFHATLDTLIPQLPTVFDADWPLVPNHTDLLENNIHVDPTTGKIAGICDWGDAEVSPFGMSLGGLETMLGIRTMNEHGWSYFPKHAELREQFWAVFYHCLGGAVSEALKQRVEVARLTGLFLANGFVQDGDGNLNPATEESLDLRYLRAVVLGL
ncbi:uncharacterized protein B0I36DRAFT_367765 [Microdochium trichocladiopsis]|uniref:Aminoglycoside phosphotransferase domain-containing protein n=1 Tax=Microdochium trichocladiopsis TaxID=1682393 RepID=A0A9P8XWA1_9PEZI|nr:uncharacterized protein B0I36DRAFT_367765 [Microdochium trichocladiopsis]KAH7021350.1 hypothetical protein B0I36DRAFT_367765 [Microdochium trichocladiopsis]